MPKQDMTQLTLWGTWLLALACTASGAESRPTKHATPPPQWLLSLEHSPRQPHSGQVVAVTAELGNSITNAVLLYQVVEPGAYIELQDSAFERNWASASMRAVERGPQKTVFRAELPAEIQKNRRLVRYRLKVMDSAGQEHVTPGGGDVPANRVYFVYDGIPSWTGAIDPRSSDAGLAAPLTFPSQAMQRVQAYYLLGKRRSIENATWREQAWGKEYKYTGTLVVDGEVFDHVAFRARGGVWRYAMGKNMWKVALPGDLGFEARDDFGQVSPVRWNKLNLRACIQQGDYGERGEQGMFESVGFRLFRLAGVPAPDTHWVQLRIIDEANENPRDQYRGDFWGLYLAIENEDGRFLKAHNLPSGNLFKMEGGGGQLQHHGPGAVTNLSDLFGFMNTYRRGNLSEAWWRTNFDLANYYSYLSICECIHHYDVGEGKNYDFYHHPQTGQWQIIPWDIDLTWADHMYGSGNDPFKHQILSRPAFRLEYQNRLREIRDLLFNPEQTGEIIDEYASVIWDRSGAPSIVEADRRKWDYHPIMAMGMKAGQGLFYQAAQTRDFPGMVQSMKAYVKHRGAWIDSMLLNDAKIPDTPRIAFCGPAGFPSDQLRFNISEYKGANGFAAMQWRLAEVHPSNTGSTGPRPHQNVREINAVWESPELDQSGEAITIPPGISLPAHTYRVRARVKDVTGRWSHWSAPVEFQPR